MEVFHLIPEKKHKFVTLVQETLQSTYVSVKTLQRLVGKCTSFSQAVPGARLFTREMNAAISLSKADFATWCLERGDFPMFIPGDLG